MELQTVIDAWPTLPIQSQLSILREIKLASLLPSDH
jgi:hypothetical protein